MWHTFAVAWQPGLVACFLGAPYPEQPFGACKHERAKPEMFMGAISHGAMLTIAYSCLWLAAGSSSMTLVKGSNVPVSTTLRRLGAHSFIILRPCTRCWRAHPDLNQGAADLQSAALATELCTQLCTLGKLPHPALLPRIRVWWLPGHATELCTQLCHLCNLPPQALLQCIRVQRLPGHASSFHT